MSNKRTLFLLPLLAGFGLLLVWGLLGLPPVGQYLGPYGDVVNAATVPERHVTDAVSAVNFDYRGFDTLGEEFILFTSVMGVLLLLRKHPDEEKESEEVAEQRPPGSPNDAARVLSYVLIGITVLFGLYITTHGHLTPGGGFQGGVIITSALLLLFLAGNTETFKKVIRHQMVETGEAIGAGGFALTGIVGLMLSGALLYNFLPLGQTGSVLSGGTIWLLSVVTGLEVSSGIFLLSTAFLEDALEHFRTGGHKE
jgi:multicomponent Na+:H+ antiporter subunit B